MSEREQPRPEASLEDPRVFEALAEYQEAAERGQAPDRRTFLAQHAEIAEALEECLEGLEALNEVSSSDPPPAITSVPAEGLSGAPLGDFRIIREIGRGGMGVVYEAEQLSLGRRVALKVLPFASALDARQLQRFKNEAQAAAHLHHPHIVPVYGIGIDRGVHFYAMQIIDGQNLSALVAELRGGVADRERSGTAPWTADPASGKTAVAAAQLRTPLGLRLSTQRSSRADDFFRTVARLVAQTAEALDYAHGVGIIHRDIKPANLLVDGRGNVWITDFGLAQFHADAGLTQTGDLVGTLRYMSPEQAGGQRVLIDHRSDVYSLGATLYELLTLRPIFDGADRQRLLHQILHEEPKPPRAVDRSVPPELEVIILKAVAKTPADRYATAQEFAEDLHRFLDNRPILARRPTLAQRARKWFRRHPSVLVAGVVLMVLLAVASLFSAWFIRAEQDRTQRAYELLRLEQEKTQHAYESERRRAEEAEREFLLARRSVDDLIEIAEQQLSDNPQLHGVRKLMLEAALEYYEEFLEQRRDDPAAAPQLEATRARVKQILDDLAVLQGAGRLNLLRDAVVLEDLRVSEQQRGRLEDLARRMDEQRRRSFEGFHRLKEEERRKRFLESAAAHEAGVAEILGQGKLARLKQIELQRKAAGAFREAEVVAVLKLTAEQRERVRSIEASAISGGPPPWGGPGRKGPEPPVPPEVREQKMRSAVDQILALLTEEQAKRWKQMAGEPFKGAFTPPPGQPGRPGPR